MTIVMSSQASCVRYSQATLPRHSASLIAQVNHNRPLPKLDHVRCIQLEQQAPSPSFVPSAVRHRQTRKSTTCSLFSLLPDRKSTRLNSSHSQISYAVFCLKK